MGDMELALAECRAAQSEGREISDAAARVIASMYHSGQGSITYTFASTGALATEGMGASQLVRDLLGDYTVLSADGQLLYNMMGTYLLSRYRDERTGPVAGWSGLWLFAATPRRGGWGGMAGAGAEFI